VKLITYIHLPSRSTVYLRYIVHVARNWKLYNPLDFPELKRDWQHTVSEYRLKGIQQVCTSYSADWVRYSLNKWGLESRQEQEFFFFRDVRPSSAVVRALLRQCSQSTKSTISLHLR
jgi:hypothetical protein